MLLIKEKEESKRRSFRSCYSATSPAIIKSVLPPYFTVQANEAIGARLGKLKAPIHIMAGAQDPGGFVSYEMKLVAPKAQLRWINRCGHFPMYEQPDEFYKLRNRSFQESKQPSC